MIKLIFNKRLLHRKGFTLLELLVVVGIVGLLSAIVIAGISNARIRAINLRIDSTIREYSNGLQAFAIKNGRFPYFSQCQETGIPVTGNGGVWGVCLGEYPDEGYGAGCGLYLKTQSSYSTFEDSDLNSQLLDHMSSLPKLEPIPIVVPSQFEDVLENHIRGALYICSEYNPDGSVVEATIRYFKIHSGESCLPGAISDSGLDIFDVTTCLLPIKA